MTRRTTRRTTRGYTRGDRRPIEEVLELIDAQPIPDADELARMSVSEIERQLADSGVDMDAELSELFGQVESPPMQALANLSVSDVEQLSITEVERRLEAEGVDVRAWLSRAETLIRNARARAPMDEARAGSARAPSRGLRGAASRSALPRSSGRQRRRMPQALAASIVMVVIASVTFSMLDEPELNDRAPDLSEATLALAPDKNEPVVVRETSRKREGTQLAQVRDKQNSLKQGALKQGVSKQGAFKRDLRTFDQSSEDSRGDAVLDRRAAVADAPLLSVDESRPASRLIPPKTSISPPSLTAPTSPTAATAATAATAIVSANAVAKREAKTPAVARSLAPEMALRAPMPPQKSPQKSFQESPEKYRSAPSRADDAVAREQSAPQPGASMPRAAAASRTEKKMAEAVASIGVVREPRLKAGTASEADGADEALTAVHALPAGRTFAVSLAGLTLREDDRKALLRVFADVDVSSGASLRLSIRNEIVQTAAVQLLQGRWLTAVRDSRGRLVLER